MRAQCRLLSAYRRLTDSKAVDWLAGDTRRKPIANTPRAKYQMISNHGKRRPATTIAFSMTIEVHLLGTAQDAGVPQAGCQCQTCARARRRPEFQQYVAALGLIDRVARSCWIIDATPDFKPQHAALMAAAPGCELRGIVLTHAHIGHYTGLIHLGKEVMNTRRLPVYATASMCAFIRANGPWSQLVTNDNIALIEITPDVPLALSDQLRITPLLVPHRAEYSDTCAFVIAGPARTLFYCPDIDRWEKWSQDVRVVVRDHDISLLDGSFYSGDELGGRDMALIPHPLVTHSMALLRGHGRDVRFIHFNHTNPLLTDGSPQRTALHDAGFGIGMQGECWVL